jgi:hypothetical protein
MPPSSSFFCGFYLLAGSRVWWIRVDDDKLII